LAEKYTPYLSVSEILIVPTLVQHELYKWLCREKDLPTALSVIAATQSANVVPLDTSVALFAADIAREYKLAMADAIIYATARHKHANVVTSDTHFEGFPQVIYFPSCIAGFVLAS